MSAHQETNLTTTCPTCGAETQADYLIPAGETQICPACRDTYRQRLNEGLSAHSNDDFEAIRQLHIKHEASLRSVGILCYIGGAFTLLGGLMMVLTLAGSPAGSGVSGEGSGFILGLAIFYGLFGVGLFVLARGYRQLKPWVRIPGTIVSCLGLLSIPIGTLINGYILYLLWSQKGKVVLSSEYAQIIAATPHSKYKTSPLVWIVLALLIIGLVAAVFWAAASGF